MPPRNRAILRLLTAAAAAFFSIHLLPEVAHPQSDASPKSTKPSFLPPDKARELQKQKKAAEEQKKINSVNKLIQNINKKLKLRTSGQEVFERKKALENRLRDMITFFEMADQAMSEAIRLAREVEEIQKIIQNGPKDPRRLQLANFLEARRREYILFATR